MSLLCGATNWNTSNHHRADMSGFNTTCTHSSIKNCGILFKNKNNALPNLKLRTIQHRNKIKNHVIISRNTNAAF